MPLNLLNRDLLYVLLNIFVVIVFVLVGSIYIQDLQVLFDYGGLVHVIVELVEIVVYYNQLLMFQLVVLLHLFQVVYMVLKFVVL